MAVSSAQALSCPAEELAGVVMGPHSTTKGSAEVRSASLPCPQDPGSHWLFFLILVDTNHCITPRKICCFGSDPAV